MKPVVTKEKEDAYEFICKQAKRHKVPAHEENMELIRKAQAGDRKAQIRLVSCHSNLVMLLVQRFGKHPTMSPEDLHQEGMFGLLRSLQNFNPDAGFRFSTYAAKVITQYMERACRLRGDVVKRPPVLAQKLVRAQRAWSKHIEEHQEQPSVVQLAETCKLTVEELELCKQLLKEPVSLDEPVGDEADGFALVDLFECEKAVPHVKLEDEWDKYRLDLWLDQLEPRDRDFIRFRYGLADGEPKTRIQLALKFQVSELEVQRWERRVIDQLKYIRESEANVFEVAIPYLDKFSKQFACLRFGARNASVCSIGELSVMWGLTEDQIRAWERKVYREIMELNAKLKDEYRRKLSEHHTHSKRGVRKRLASPKVLCGKVAEVAVV